MNKKQKIVSLILPIFLLLSISFVLAAYTPTFISTNAFTFNVSKIVNISIANTDDLEGSNITIVNITLPTSLKFISNTNNTNNINSPVTSNNSISLIWQNDSGLVTNKTTSEFWFNATASLIGSYNIIVTLTNSTTTKISNLAITITEATKPAVTIVYPLGTTIVTSSTVQFNSNFTDNYALGSATLYVWETASSTPYTTSATVAGTSNTSNLTYSPTMGDKQQNQFIWNYYVCDSSNNCNFAIANKTFDYQPTYQAGGVGGISGGGSSTTSTTQTTQTEQTSNTVVDTGSTAQSTNIFAKIKLFFTNFFDKILSIFKRN